MQRHEQIIIKRGRRNSHETGHGGAWKVAFADFMIALMALFLVLWILAIVDKTERKAIVAYLNSSSLFDQGSGNPFNTSTSLSPIDLGGEAADLSSHDAAVTVTSFYDGNGDGSQTDALVQGTYETQEQLKVLAQVVEELAKQVSAEGNVHVDVTPQGLRIVLQDDFRQNMFHRGSSELTPFFEDLLLALAPIFQKIQNPLIISGHTDAVRYNRAFSESSNWELSASRANAARQTLIAGGAPENHVLQVAGLADRAPLNPEEPEASENRRIELFVLTSVAARMVETLFKGAPANDEGPVLQQAREKAEFNQPVIRQDYIEAS
ncbi:flagellar motor protein MotB [Photobacterium halotolerans]|uniref:OmpA family protein n=1 Tax=Photobacterium halotolerans TaxID=265726 RepID=A0A7X4WQ29_9GAMM|nr:flagellar motor protein MotB [Photobacterium halotolerans]NAW64802.1 OmpA family protein [Photobacterium halotolerans]NAW86744.1 OmpA family protein [Photobacterium halotolerans]NAX49208.1 OmpA family protein [Photobacterium halotolerans]